MKKKNTLTSLIMQQNVLTLLLLTFVVIMIWVSFSVYFSYSKTAITPTDAALIAPLTPRLDSALFDKLALRKRWTSEELAAFQTSIVVTSPVPTAVPAATPIPTLEPVATSSATPAPTPTLPPDSI